MNKDENKAFAKHLTIHHPEYLWVLMGFYVYLWVLMGTLRYLWVLMEPCHQGDCTLCLSGDDKGGLRHHRSGAVYKGECKLCGEGISDYWRESGDSAYCRCQQHKSAILNKDENNAFAKHLAIHHPEQEGNIDAFRFKLVETHSQPLSRLCSESVHIHTSEAQIPMNSKAEWHAPVHYAACLLYTSDAADE